MAFPENGLLPPMPVLVLGVGGVLTHEAASHGILIYTDPWPKPYDRKPGKMTFTTASGLLPAGIAVYVQRGLNGVLLEMRYLVRLQGLTSQSETR